jgi:hypothetical protein
MYAESDHLVLKYRNQQHRLRYVDVCADSLSPKLSLAVARRTIHYGQVVIKKAKFLKIPFSGKLALVGCSYAETDRSGAAIQRTIISAITQPMALLVANVVGAGLYVFAASRGGWAIPAERAAGNFTTLP